ncbi:MAG: hypothetical protein IT385_30555, partial [Deltaproteobacteria bacterium]|nr:hypothetical protein [Deltaproteobacteria bacterium]
AHVALVEAGAGVVTVAIADGTRTALATPAALADVGVAPDLVVPVDAEGAFAVQVAGASGPRVAWLEAGQAPRLVFELPAAVAVAPDDLRDLPRGELVVIGYAHASDALLVRARTTWREHLWAIRAGGEVVPLGRMTGQEVVYPDWTATYADGVMFNAAARVDDLGRRGWIGPLMTPELDHVPTTLEAPPFLPYPPIPAWGPVIAVDPERGALEMVRVPRRAVPGELYVWGRSGLLRQVPRGGLVPLFEEGDLGWHGGVTGLALSADYALCAVQHARGEIRLLVPITADSPPVGEGGRLTLPGARDCGWGVDGSLWVLAVGEDPGVWVRPASGGALARRDDIDVGDDPLRFTTPSPFEGEPAILDRATGVCGRLVTRAGHEVEVACATGALTFAGQPVELTGPSTFRGFGGEIVLAERADGRLVATRGDRGSDNVPGADGPWVIDLASGTVYASWVDGSGAGFGIAVRPGPAIDPWTGAPAATLPRPEGADVPETPGAPSGGQRIHMSIDGPCAGGGATGAWLACAALVLAWRGRRRRESPAR